MDRGAALAAGFRIDDAALRGANNFHLIRLGAALLVVFAHSFHLVLRAGEEPVGQWFIWLDASLLGVTTFFFISGFLIARSWDSRQSLVDFLAARAVRILPALWVVIVVTALCLGPAVTTLPVAEYFADRDTWRYLVFNSLLLTFYKLPGVFQANPMPGINGALWTIPLEAFLYVILGAVGWLGLFAPGGGVQKPRFRSRPYHALLLALVAGIMVYKIVHTGWQYYSLAAYFILGAAAYRFRSHLRLNLIVSGALVLLAVAGARTSAGPVLYPFALGYLILTLALHPAFRMPVTWLHRNDYSYGTYLYGFPVQQSLIALGVQEPLLLFACSAPVTIGLAALSWHAIEQPLLDRKRTISNGLRRRLYPSAAPT